MQSFRRIAKLKETKIRFIRTTLNSAQKALQKQALWPF